MPSNVEIKARLKDRDRALLAAREIGSAAGVLRQTDTFLYARTGRLKLREFGDGTAELIHYHRSDSATSRESRYERMPVDDAAAALRILSSACGVRGVVRKVRDLFISGQSRIHVDAVEGLGNFLEIEVVLSEHQTTNDGELIAWSLLKRLGLGKADVVGPAYIDLLEASSGKGAPLVKRTAPIDPMLLV